MVVQIKGVSQGSTKFLSRTTLGKTTLSDSWYAKLDTTTTDVGNGVAIDSSGNVYVVGTSNSADVLIIKYDKTGSLVWQRKLSGASSTEDGKGIAVDNLGNVYIVGTINNGVTDDILIAKYNTSGTLLWQTTLAGSDIDTGRAIAVDSSGNVYITGHIYNGSNDDIITAKYDTNGNILWQRKLASNPQGNNEIAYGIAVDSSGNVYITGMFVVGSTWDILIAKYNSSGSIQWQRRLAGAGTDVGYGIAVDSSGNVYIAGYTGSDALIAKYDTNGNISPNGWQRRLEGGFSGSGIAVDSSGNAYIGGITWNGSNYDILIAKYNSSGVIQWQRTLASSSNDYGFGIALDSSGTNVYIAGQTGTDILIAKLPADGSIVNPTYTGKLKLIHSASSLSESAGGLTPSTPTLADSAGTLDSFKCDLYSSDPALTTAIVKSEVPVSSSTSSLTSTTSVLIQTLASAGIDVGNGIVVDSSGNYYITGSTGTDILIAKYNGLGTVLWQRTLTGASTTGVGRGIALDSSGNVYIAGPGGASNGLSSVIAKYDTNGNIVWQKVLMGMNSQQQATINGIAVDSFGNVYTTGSYGSISTTNKWNNSGELIWQRNISELTSSAIAVDSSGNVYIAGGSGKVIKYNSSGSIVWKSSLSVSGYYIVGNGIAVDSSGNVYVTGWFYTTAGANRNVIMIAKYNPSGTLLWGTNIDDNSNNDSGNGIAVDSSGNAYIIAYTSSANAALIVKYNPSGTLLWQRTFASAGTNVGNGIAVDSSGNVYITGYTGTDILIAKIPNDGGSTTSYGSFTYTASNLFPLANQIFSSTVAEITETNYQSWGYQTPSPLLTSSASALTNTPSIAVQTLASAGTDVGNGIAVDSSGNYYITGNTGTDILIAKYNSSGIIEWQRRLAGSGTDVGNGIAVDVSGNVYIAGTSNDDIIIAKYNTSGTLQWQTTLASTSSTDLGNAIAVDSSGNYYITGNTGTDILIAKYDTNGAIVWQRRLKSSISDSDNENGNGIAVDGSGNVYIVGYYYDAILIIKCNTLSGTIIWQRGIYSGNTDAGRGVAVDSSGNVYIAGGSGNATIAKYDTNGNISPNGWQRSLVTSADAMAIAVDSSGNAYITSKTGSDILIAKYNGTTAAIVWQRTLASANVESGLGIAVDSSNNVYITGNTNNDIIIAKIPNDGGTAGTYGTFTYTASSLTSSTSTFTTETSVLLEFAGTLVPDKGVWISTFGASGSSLESANGIALDSAKNIYTIGKTLHTSGTTDSLLVKYNNSGTIQWQRTLTGSNSNDSGNGIAIDSSDNIYTVGTTGSNANDIVISKYNTSGVIQWQAILGTNTAQTGNGIAVDSSGNVYITGLSNDDLLTVKYNTSGTLQWQRTLVGANGDLGTGIAVDSSGDVYIIGYYSQTSVDIIIVKYNTSGTLQWHRGLSQSGGGNDSGYGIAVDSSSNVYTIGRYFNNNDIIIAKYNSSGTIQWQRGLSLSGGSTDAGYGIAVDSSGNVYITGSTNNGSNDDIIIAKYDTSGTLQWQRTLAGTSTADVGRGIKVDGDYVYITGSTSTGAKSLIAKLPNDGTYTGTYGSFTYASSNLSAVTPSLTSGSASVAQATSTLTSSLILNSTELNASSVNNYLR